MSISFAITVNGERHDVAIPNILTYDDIANMAFGEKEGGHPPGLTCVYKSPHASGSIYQGGPGVRPKPEMRFTIISTSAA